MHIAEYHFVNFGSGTTEAEGVEQMNELADRLLASGATVLHGAKLRLPNIGCAVEIVLEGGGDLADRIRLGFFTADRAEIPHALSFLAARGYAVEPIRRNGKA